MVRVEVVRATNDRFYHDRPFVAVFVGATAGIGEYTAKALATTYAKQGRLLRVYLVGRSTDAGNKLVSGCSKVCPDGSFTFVRAENAALVQDVDRVCGEISRLEQQHDRPRIDMLVMTQGQVTFGAREGRTLGIPCLPRYIS